MPHNETQSVSRMMENITYGLTGRDWKSVYGLVNKSLCNRKGRATGYQTYEIRRQSFTLPAVLVQILTNAIRQLTQLQQILGTNSDTLRLLREVNRGIKDGLDVIRVLDPKFNPGLYGDLQTVDRVLKSIEDLYGAVPKTAEARLQAVQDLSASESIAMNGTLFRYADQVDRESHRIFEHSQNVNPQGAAKLTAQSVAILIGVTTQVLRTNSMMLKLMGQNMALSNRKDKIQAAQFRTQYQELSTALSGLKTENKLSTLRGGL